MATMKIGSFVTTKYHTVNRAKTKLSSGKISDTDREFLRALTMVHGHLGTVEGETENYKVLIKFLKSGRISGLQEDMTIALPQDELDLIDCGKKKFALEQVVSFEFGIGVVKAIAPAWRTSPSGYQWLYNVHYIKDGEIVVCPDSRCPRSRGDFTPPSGCPICSRSYWDDRIKPFDDFNLNFLIEEGIVPKQFKK